MNRMIFEKAWLDPSGEGWDTDEDYTDDEYDDGSNWSVPQKGDEEGGQDESGGEV